MIGIDVSKESLTCTYVDPVRRVPLWEQTIPNSHEGILALKKRTSGSTAWVMEPTGRFSLSVAKEARALGQQVFIAPSRKAKQFLSSVQNRAKTDRLDSAGLALFALSRPLDAYPVKSPQVEQTDQLLSARRGMVRAYSSLKQRQKALPYAQDALEPAISALAAQIKALDKKIQQQVQSDPKFASAKRLEEITGVGKTTAAAVSARLADKGFTHPDQFVAYIGLDVNVRDSGKHRGQRRLTKQGDSELRRLLYLCAQASLRAKDSPLRAQYERELQKGLSRTAAICVVARKLAKVCWSIHTHGTNYDPNRVGKQNRPKEENPSDSA